MIGSNLCLHLHYALAFGYNTNLAIHAAQIPAVWKRYHGLGIVHGTLASQRTNMTMSDITAQGI